MSRQLWLLKRWLTAQMRRLQPNTTLLLAALPIVAGMAYAGLYVVHQEFFDELGLQATDAGLDRDDLLARTFVGFLMVTGAGALAYLVFTLALFGLLLLTLRMVKALVRPLMRWTRTRRLATRVRHYRLNAPGLPQRVLNFGLAVLAAAGPIAVVVLLSSSHQEAQRVRDGYPTQGLVVFGVPLIEIQANRFEVVRQPAEGPLRTGTSECMLYLGRDDSFLSFYDVRRQQAVRLPDEEYDVAVRPEAGRSPPRCRPQPDVEPDDVVEARGRGLGELTAEGEWLAWSQRDRAGLFELVVRFRYDSEASLAGRSSRPMTPDLGPGSGRVPAVVYRRCHGRRCGLYRYDLAEDRERRLPVDTPRGCTTAWPAIWRSTVVFARRGLGCAARHRGLWMLHGRRVSRLIGKAGPGLRDLDLRGDTVVWTEGDAVSARLRSMRLDQEAPRTEYENATPGEGDRALLASAALTPEAIMLTDATAYTGDDVRGVDVVDGEVIMLSRNDASCRVLAQPVPENLMSMGQGRTRGIGVDAVVTGDVIRFATAGALYRRGLSAGLVDRLARSREGRDEDYCRPVGEEAEPRPARGGPPRKSPIDLFN